MLYNVLTNTVSVIDTYKGTVDPGVGPIEG